MLVSVLKMEGDNLEERLLYSIPQAKVVRVKDNVDRLLVETELESLFSFQLAIFRHYHPHTAIISILDNQFKETYDSMYVVDKNKDDKLVIDGETFTGECYITYDKTGATIWANKPSLKDDRYVGDGSPDFYPSTMSTYHDGATMPVLTGAGGTDKPLMVDLKGIYKLTMRNIKE